MKNWIRKHEERQGEKESLRKQPKRDIKLSTLILCKDKPEGGSYKKCVWCLKSNTFACCKICFHISKQYWNLTLLYRLFEHQLESGQEKKWLAWQKKRQRLRPIQNFHLNLLCEKI